MKTIYATPYIIELATSFWKKAGDISSWPRDLDQAVAVALPIDVVSLSRLSTKKIEKWFRSRNFSYQLLADDKLLHGFIMMNRGKGFIFLNGTDSKEERLFTLAHEVSHYIIDYQQPRIKASKVFGKRILEVVDRLRPPTSQEQVDSVLLATEIKPYTHLLAKGSNSYCNDLKIWQAEDKADALAFELLAPFNSVYADLKEKSVSSYKNCCAVAEQLLINKYGLPSSVTSLYAHFLARSITGGPSALESLGLI